MTYDEMLQAHVREFDRMVARIRAIMLERNYDNDESPEMKDLRRDLSDVIMRTFRVKCCAVETESILTRERNAMEGVP